MSLKYSGEGASPSDSWSSTVCPFLVAISFATVIPLLLLFRGSSLHDRLRDLWDLLGLASTHPPGSSTAIQGRQLNEEDTDSTHPPSSTATQIRQSNEEDTDSTHPPGCSTAPQVWQSNEEDTDSTHPPGSTTTQVRQSNEEDTDSTHPPGSTVTQSNEEDTDSTHPPSSTVIQSNEEDSSSTNLQSEVSPPQRDCKYDVFLSFGPDVENNFVDRLYKHLIGKGIFPLKYVETGEGSPQLIVEAVKDSRAAIVVFSEKYPTSSTCLEGMSTIADLRRKSQQIVLSVFYHIDPKEVRNPRNTYKECFDSLYTKFANHPGKVDRWIRDMFYLGCFDLPYAEFANDPGKKVDRWKKDMNYLGYLNGHTVGDGPEAMKIEEITHDVIDKLDYKFPLIAHHHLIGMQPRIEELKKRLKLKSEDDKFRILGIWGMGGIGKTAHAKVLFNKIAYQFDASCFVEDISKFYRKGGGGATEVQRIILQQTEKDLNLEECSTDLISHTIQNRLCNKDLPRKVLIVLDNVEEQCQWDELTLSSLGRESRVIMTTRNQDTLEKIADYRYEVPLLNNDDARQLFLRTVGSDTSNSFTDILEYAQGLPLAIERLRYFFRSINEEYWVEALENMRKFPEKKVMNVLQRSYDELRPNEQQIFLHIACFFGGKREKYVKHILDNCGILGHGHGHALQRITKKSLIIIRNEEIHMHKMLQELGKDLVRRNYPDKPELWSRLWHHDDFEKALMSKKETNNVEAIVLDQEEDVSKFCHLMEGLSKWSDLKLFILHHKKCSMSNLDLLLNQLQYNLVELNLPSSIQELWKGEQETNNVEAIVFIRKRMSPNSVT